MQPRKAMLKQGLQQKMQQKLLPLQIQIMKLLEVPATQIEERIKEELEENPVLEIDSNLKNDDEATGDTPQDNADTTIEDYVRMMDDTPAYKLKTNNFSPDDQREDIPFSEGISFYEHLEEQIGLQNFTERQNQIAKYVIGNIDEDGYLRRTPAEIADDVSFATNTDVDENEVDEVLAVVRQFDPAGVGAADLQQCLVLQLRMRNLQDPINALALQVVENCFEEFTRKHYDKILRRLHITDKDDLRDAIEEILHLNPKPGSAYSGTLVKTAQHIIPDFIVEFEDNKLISRLNTRNEPELRISAQYTDLLREYVHNRTNQSREQKEAVLFVRQKLTSARWFIDALRQRRNTLQLVMNAILEYQSDYFVDGDEAKLRPMILKDIAERTGLDASTISRVSNSKYVQTHFGIFPIKHFFSEALQNADGEEVSTREVKKILADSIADEDKNNPLTDERLVEILSQKNYNIARRTVAKYREMLGIPVARLRKQL